MWHQVEKKYLSKIMLWQQFNVYKGSGSKLPQSIIVIFLCDYVIFELDHLNDFFLTINP